MKEIMAMREMRWALIGNWITAGAVMIAVFMAFGQAIAKDKNEGPVAQDTSWHPGNAKNVKEYFEGKYGKLRDISSTVRMTQHGPKGHLGVSGEINMGNVPAF